MKRLIVASLALLSIGLVKSHAAESVVEAPVGYVGGPFSLNPSTTSWTKIWLATATVSDSTTGRSHAQAGVLVNNRLSNTKGFGCVISTGTPSVSTMTWSVQIDPGENSLVSVVDTLFLYCVSIATAAERMDAQFLRQAP